MPVLTDLENSNMAECAGDSQPNVSDDGPAVRKITDFFKQPTKQTIPPPKQPNTLLGYFKKTNGASDKTGASHKPGGLVGLSQQEKEGQDSRDDTPLSEKKLKDEKSLKTGKKKRKLEDNDGIDKPKVKKKKTGVEKHQTVVENSISLNDSAEDFESVPQRNCYNINPTSDVKDKARSLKVNEKGRKDTDTAEESDSILEISYHDYLNNLQEDDCAEVKELENDEHCEELVEKPNDSVVNTEREKSEKENTGNDSSSVDKADISYEDFLRTMKNDEENSNMAAITQMKVEKEKQKIDNNKEMSYEHFLQTCDKEVDLCDPISSSEEADEDIVSKRKGARKNNIADSDSESKECNASPKITEEIPNPKMGIERFFFKKKEKSVAKEESDDEATTMVVKADIHPQPSPPPVSKSLKARQTRTRKKLKTNVVISSDDPAMDIVVIEDVKGDVENNRKSVAKKSKEGIKGKDVDSSDKSIHQGEKDGQTNEKIENNAEAKDVVMETNVLPVKEPFPNIVVDESLLKKKTSQSTLNFGQKSLKLANEISPVVKDDRKEDSVAKIKQDLGNESMEVIETPIKKSVSTKKTSKKTNDKCSLKKTTCLRDRKTSTPLKSDPVESRKKQKGKSARSLKSVDDSFETPVKKAGKRLANVKINTPKNVGSAKKAALKKIYKSEVKEDGDLKLTLRRVKKPLPVGKPKTEKKQTKSKAKAQKLLVKAKNAKSKPTIKKKAKCDKTKKGDASNDLRRSSRQSSVTARKAISETLSPESSSPVKKARKLASPTKSSKGKGLTKSLKCPKASPKKGGKIPSMFLKKGAKEAEPVKPVVEKPQLSESVRAFLFSGIPEHLKKKAAEVASIQLSEHAPIPKISHVQQIPHDNQYKGDEVTPSVCDKKQNNDIQETVVTCDVSKDLEVSTKTDSQGHSENEKVEADMNEPACSTESVTEQAVESKPEILFSKLFEKNIQLGRKTDVELWNLPDVELKLKHDDKSTYSSTPEWCKTLLPSSESAWKQQKVNQNFEQHPALKPDVVQVLLSEIGESNPDFPVQRMYKQLKAKKELVMSAVEKSEPTKERAASSSSDVVVVESPETEPKNKAKSRKAVSKGISPQDAPKPTERRSSKRGKRKPSDDVVLVEEKAEVEVHKTETTNSKDCKPVSSQLWTDQYCPTHSKDIIGNTAGIRKLRQWLQEWKQRMDREARAIQKQLMKEAKKKPKSGWLTDDDSDFEMSDNSSSTFMDDDGLCNTTVLLGPHGIGKTTSVTALAEELGYKIFEVNSSTKRSGKLILSQLQEATQSHQVCKKGLGAGLPGNPTNIEDMFAIKPPTTPKTEKPKLPSAFAGFFKKAPSKQEDEKSKKTGKSKETSAKDGKAKDKKDKKVDVEKSIDAKSSKKGSPVKKLKSSKTKTLSTISAGQDCNSQDTSVGYRGLNLSSVSLILFEEVDVIFEEDKGFWSAVQTLMTDTKKPIIMTTSNTKFTLPFEGRCEQILYKPPSLVNITTLLQTVCLVENVRTQSEDIHLVAEAHQRDIRRSINYLQYWLTTGGGIKTHSKSLSQSLLASHVNQPRSTPDSPVAPKHKRRRIQPIIDDDSMSDFDSHSQHAVQSTPQPVQISLDVIPNVHCGSFDSLFGINTTCGDDEILDCLKDMTHPIINKVELSTRLNNLDNDIIYSNLLNILPLPKVISAKTDIPLPMTESQEPPVTSRTRIMNDLFDSEGSEDGFLSLAQPKPCAKPETNIMSTKTISKEDNTPVQKDSPLDKTLLLSSITALSEMYDSMSFCDAHMSLPCRTANSNNSKLLPGLVDHVTKYEDSHWPLNHQLTEMSKYVECVQLKSCCEKLQDVVMKCEDCGSKVIDKLSLPVDTISHGLKLEGGEIDTRLGSTNNKVFEHVRQLLPDSAHNPARDIAMDYIPTIRLICKTEQNREVAKVKRRFMHYLTGIGMVVKPTIMESLCSTF